MLIAARIRMIAIASPTSDDKCGVATPQQIFFLIMEPPKLFKMAEAAVRSANFKSRFNLDVCDDAVSIVYGNLLKASSSDSLQGDPYNYLKRCATRMANKVYTRSTLPGYLAVEPNWVPNGLTEQTVELYTCKSTYSEETYRNCLREPLMVETLTEAVYEKTELEKLLKRVNSINNNNYDKVFNKDKFFLKVAPLVLSCLIDNGSLEDIKAKFFRNKSSELTKFSEKIIPRIERIEKYLEK